VTAIPARRRRRLVAAVITSVLTVVSLPGGLVLGANMLLNDSGGQNVETEALIRIPSTPVHLVAVTNSRNELASLALFAIDPGLQGGTIVSIPVGAAADTPPDVAPRRIADSYLTGGLDALRVDVEDLLNITIDSARVHTAPELAVELAAVGEQSLSLPQPIVDNDALGAEVVVLDVAETTVGPDKIAAGLAASRTGFDELSRFSSVKALWTSVSRAGTESKPSTNSEPTTSTTIVDLDGEESESATTAEYVAMLLKGRIDVWQFEATRLTDAERNPNAVDLYGLDGGEVLMVMASVAPSALRLVSNNLAVMIDTPFNNSTFAREVVTRLAYAGANVVLVRHTSEPPAERTVAFVNDSIVRAEVENYTGLIGPIEFVETLERIDGVNVRIVLGNDFAAFLGNGGVTPTTVVE
jgi:hypothetical protein